MQLKPYQQQVIADLERFLALLTETPGRPTRVAFDVFWREHPRSPVVPTRNEAVEPYKENVPGVPHLCLKVPTGGGKTLLACAAVEPVFRAYPMLKSRAVVWLVPSLPILEQTLKNLRDKSHPYRMRLDAAFGSRVEVYDKQRLLGGLHETATREQLTVVALSFDSLRARNKEDRKLNQENGANIGFDTENEALDGLDGIDPTSSMAALRALNPLVIVDESHNAETELSVEMLRNLNPSLILDLTATPRKNSNLLSIVDGWELKKEHMIKLPVIVHNYPEASAVLEKAVYLQKTLEESASAAQAKGGRYIRPIVLFQAQPKSNDDAETFEKVKKQLIEAGIAAEKIKIKTAQINELKGVDLLSEHCPVRFIITVNALKEGWDCPFAYILATLANKSSAVDVEQILGRILRQPHARKSADPVLNTSFVLTSSARFHDTLDNIVRGLNRAGFSKNDYQLVEKNRLATAPPPTGNLFSEVQDSATLEWNTAAQPDFSRLETEGMAAASPEIRAELARLTQQATAEQERVEANIAEAAQNQSPHIPDALSSQVKKHLLRDVFREQAKALRLPQFFYTDGRAALFEVEPVFFDKKALFEGFELSKENAVIDFDNAPADAWKIDLDEADHLPKFTRLDGPARAYLTKFLLDPNKKDKRGETFINRMSSLLGRLDHIPDHELRGYLQR
ncbi:MAG: DEAD/DEAH box helicase, partial [Saprospiraceae bacterium]